MQQTDIAHYPDTLRSSALTLKLLPGEVKSNNVFPYKQVCICTHFSACPVYVCTVATCIVQFRVTECEINFDIHGSNLPRPSSSGTLRAECHSSDRE